jgi:hypothetical protein
MIVCVSQSYFARKQIYRRLSVTLRLILSKSNEPIITIVLRLPRSILGAKLRLRPKSSGSRRLPIRVIMNDPGMTIIQMCLWECGLRRQRHSLGIPRELRSFLGVFFWFGRGNLKLGAGSVGSTRCWKGLCNICKLALFSLLN